MNGAKDTASNLEHGCHAGGSEVEVAVVQEELSFATIGCCHSGFGDWERSIWVDWSDDFYRGNDEFMTAF